MPYTYTAFNHGKKGVQRAGTGELGCCFRLRILLACYFKLYIECGVVVMWCSGIIVVVRCVV